MKIIPVILSGGSGARLWPLSRTAYPKQFLQLTPGGLTLLQETAERVKDNPLFGDPIIICDVEHRFIVPEQLRDIGIITSTIILEPMRKSTAPAITLAALCVQERYGNDALMLVMPSDHRITKLEEFLRAVTKSITAAQKGVLVTFGVSVTHPETGYGYIQAGKIVDKEHGVYAIERFIEKPNAEKAKEYMSSGDYLWNSGIFFFTAESFLGEIEKFAPAIVTECKKAIAGNQENPDLIRLDATVFRSVPSVSIDNAVMELTKKGAIMPLECGWSDLGSWDSVWLMHAKDPDGNAVAGNARAIDSKDTYVHSDGPFVVALGLENIVVIGTKDAVLVVDKSKVQDIKSLVSSMDAAHQRLVEHHPRVYRPWGYYEAVDEGNRYQVKHLRIKPKEKLSLQMHHHRAEHWIVVQGMAKIILDDKEYIRSENQSFYVPIGATHSLENPGKIDLDIIEVQTGSYLGEDDIIRFADKYNRDTK